MGIGASPTTNVEKLLILLSIREIVTRSPNLIHFALLTKKHVPVLLIPKLNP
jgi:hypothetical protein